MSQPYFSKRRPKSQAPVYANGRVVGKVQAGAFRKSIDFSKHALRYPPALALSVDSLQQAKRAGAEAIEIYDRETGRVYSCAITHFMRYSFELQRGGYERQRALPLRYWTASGGNVENRPPENREDDTAVQLTLI